MLLYYITDSQGQPDRPAWLEERVLAAARAGIDWIQIREKDLPARAQFDLAVRLRRRLATSPVRPRLLINDRLDIALAAGLDGVHLPAQGLPVADVAAQRARLPAGFLIVASCHSAAAVMQAAEEGATAAVLGPIFATPSKLAYGAPLGLHALQVARQVSIPVLALGGIALDNAAACLRAGAAGLAAIRLFQSSEVAERCAILRRLWRRSHDADQAGP
ncbi:MAG TPA: thiamine phosphate synthase [Terriglobales bacterium]|nr:thiamine phosphate synthase [Terriglobales bacterium]